jgi:hypothetical protein
MMIAPQSHRAAPSSVRLRKPVECGGDALRNRLACFRFNRHGGPDHRSQVIGKLRVEPVALDDGGTTWERCEFKAG